MGNSYEGDFCRLGKLCSINAAQYSNFKPIAVRQFCFEHGRVSSSGFEEKHYAC